MTHFEIMEASGQTNIFDYIEIAPNSIRNIGFAEGDPVKIRFYQDEYDYIYHCHPQLLEVGQVIDRHLDFYRVRIGDVVIDVPGDKLTLI